MGKVRTPTLSIPPPPDPAYVDLDLDLDLCLSCCCCRQAGGPPSASRMQVGTGLGGQRERDGQKGMMDGRSDLKPG